MTLRSEDAHRFVDTDLEWLGEVKPESTKDAGEGNPNHDPKTGEFSSGEGSSGGGVSNYEKAKAKSVAIESDVKSAQAKLNAFPRGPTGLTPDDIKNSSEFKAAKSEFSKAFERQRNFNSVFTKTFAKEIKAERSNRFKKK